MPSYSTIDERFWMPIPLDDVLLNKSAIIERCIARIREEYAKSPKLDNHTHVDAMTLNIERACQAAIDTAMHIVADNHFGIPQNSADAFELLRQNGVIDKTLSHSLKAMTGFRNVAVHGYQEIDRSVLRYIAEKGVRDLVLFCRALQIRIVE